MKKLLIALTIVALASVAQAEVVASWTAVAATTVGNGSTIAANTSGYGFSMVGGSGLQTGGAASGGTIAMSPGNTASASAAYAAGHYVSFTWNDAYTLTLDSITARYSRSGGGAQAVQWGIIDGGWSSIGSEVSVTFTGTPTTSFVPTTTTFTGVSGLESGQLGAAFYNGTGSATAWVRFDSRPSATPQVALSIEGTMVPTTPVPEPATMGLLGLGALALALRRKLSK